MRHPNLSESLNRILERGEDPAVSLSLRRVSIGDIVAIDLENPDNRQRTLIFLQIDKPAGPGTGGDSAEATLVYGIFTREWLKSFIKADIPIPPNGQKPAIVGACTKNPGTPMGLTMLQFHTITIGRQLLWYMPLKPEIGWVGWDEVVRWSILDKERYQTIRGHLERDGEFQEMRLTDEVIEEIRREVAKEKDEKARWQEFIRQPLRVQTQNSVYLLGPEGEGGTRSLQKEGKFDIIRGEVIRLREGKRMIFHSEDGRTLDTSTVVSVNPS